MKTIVLCFLASSCALVGAQVDSDVAAGVAMAKQLGDALRASLKSADHLTALHKIHAAELSQYSSARTNVRAWASQPIPQSESRIDVDILQMLEDPFGGRDPIEQAVAAQAVAPPERTQHLLPANKESQPRTASSQLSECLSAGNQQSPMSWQRIPSNASTLMVAGGAQNATTVSQLLHVK